MSRIRRYIAEVVVRVDVSLSQEADEDDEDCQDRAQNELDMLLNTTHRGTEEGVELELSVIDYNTVDFEA